jgi:hypothetical protein
METINPVSGLPRKKRQTSPRPKKTNLKLKKKHLLAMRARWADPVKRAEMLAKIKFTRSLREHTYKSRSRMGVPDGMRKAEAMALWDQAREQAREFIRIMEDKDELPKVVVPGSEEEMAKKTLEEAFKYAVSPLTDAKSKAAYLRIVLDFTKTKPESKSKLTLENSADWLASLANDMPKKDDNGSSGGQP